MRTAWWFGSIASVVACASPRADSGAAAPGFGDVLGYADAADPIDVALSHDAVFVCNAQGAVQTIGIGNPAHPSDTGSVQLMAPCRSFAEAAGWIYVAADTAGLAVFQPANHFDRGEYQPDYAVRAVSVDQGTLVAWLAGSDDAGIRVEQLDVRAPAAMYSFNQASIDGPAPVAVTHDAQGVYVADADGTVHVFDHDLIEQGAWSAPSGSIEGMDAGNHVLYVALGNDGLATVDTLHLDAPETVVTWTDQGAVHDVVVVADRAYATLDDALAVLDLGQPQSPSPLGAEPIALQSGDQPDALAVDEGRAVMTDRSNNRIIIVNVEE